MKKRAIRIGIVLLIALLIPGMAAMASVPDPEECFYVADWADVISEDTEEDIVARNADMYEKCGAQICVVTVDFLDGTEIEDYAYELFNSWGIGSSEKNNGVLFLMVIGEENYYMLQGSGIENDLTVSKMQDILDTVTETPFAEGDYDAAAEETFSALVECMEKLYSITVNAETGSSNEEEETAELSRKKTIGSTESVIEDAPVQQTSALQSIWNVITAPLRWIGKVAGFLVIAGIILFIIIIACISGGRRRYYAPPPHRPFGPPPSRGGFGGPHGGRMGGFGGGHMGGFDRGRMGGFDGGHMSGGRPGGFGSGPMGGGGHSGGGFGGGGHMGGGGGSRGGGAGRR